MRKKVLVLGANFGGMSAALSVRHELHGDVDVTVVSASDHFLFNPSLIWLPFGKRDSGDSTLSADFIAGTNTSMTVAIASGLLWTTAGGDFPLELDVGGARITVTAISGASSPQTFTVSATVVNGVAKTVPAGTKVRLWRPTVRAR